MNISLNIPSIRGILSGAKKPVLWLLFFCQLYIIGLSFEKITNGLYEGNITSTLGLLTLAFWVLWLVLKNEKKARLFFGFATIILYLVAVMSVFYYHSYHDKVLVVDNKTTLNSYLLKNPLKNRILIQKNFLFNNFPVIANTKEGNPVHFTLKIGGEILAITEGDFIVIANNHPNGSKWGIDPFIKEVVTKHLINLSKIRFSEDFSDKAFFEGEVRRHLLALSNLPLQKVDIQISEIEINTGKIVHRF